MYVLNQRYILYVCPLTEVHFIQIEYKIHISPACLSLFACPFGYSYCAETNSSDSVDFFHGMEIWKQNAYQTTNLLSKLLTWVNFQSFTRVLGVWCV